jgi:tRNA nucleotidyltransferase (CCA-adding enzyme)
MGGTPQDWDIATSAVPTEVKKLFAHTFDSGLKHGTITVVCKRKHYEITTFREDGQYKDGRRPSSVRFALHIEDDLSRRDFTMNAIAFNQARGFVDPFNGRRDIEKKIIRCVGRAVCRFNEDALRMMRALRFAAQLGFDIEDETLEAITSLHDNMKWISPERIREEFVKLLTAPYPPLPLLESTRLMLHILRGRPFEGDIHAAAALIKKSPALAGIRLPLFFSMAGGDTPRLLRDLCFDNKTIREVSLCVQWLPVPVPDDRYALKKYMNALTEQILTLQALINPDNPSIKAASETMQDILAKNECFTLKDLTLKGGDIITLGVPPGHLLGDILEELLDTVMHDPAANQKNVLLRKAESIIPLIRS